MLPTPAFSHKRPPRAGLLLICLAALVLGSTGIANEEYVNPGGDEPKHLMNGVYLLDLMKDRPFESLAVLLDYTRLYYARYPALSLGHHPPLLPALEAPMYGLLGVSVAAARVVLLVSFAAAAVFLSLLVTEIYGPLVAFFAAALFVTNPFVVFFARSPLTEMPALALVLATAYSLQRFCTTGQRGALIALAVTAVLGLYAKQLVVFAFPAFLAYAFMTLGARRFLKRDIWIAAGVVVLLVTPLVPMTLVLSRTNVAAVLSEPSTTTAEVLWSAFARQFPIPVLLLAAVGGVRALVQKDRRSVLFLLWLGSVLVGVLVAGRLEPARYSIYWVPVLCVLAASVTNDWGSPALKWVAIGVILVVCVLQVKAADRRGPVGTEGYEESARFVLQSDPGPTVLFSGDVDTGFFTFFVRKHDPARRLIVLRANKLLTTTFILHKDIINGPEDVYRILHRFGTRYVVIEDQPSGSRALEWLRQEVRSARFVERRRIPIATNDARLKGTSLAIFEFLDRTSPDQDAVLEIQLPIIGQSLAVKLSDLIERKYLR